MQKLVTPDPYVGLVKMTLHLKCLLELILSVNEKLSETLKEVEVEKGCLKDEISCLKEQNTALENKLLNDTKFFDELKSQMMKEKDELYSVLNCQEDKLRSEMSEKENLSKLYSECKEKLSILTKDYNISVSKIENLSLIEEKYSETLRKVEIMKADVEEKSELLDSNALQIKEMHDLKLKYDDFLIKMKNQEDLLNFQSEELELKTLQLTEMQDLELKYDENFIIIKELEELVESKSKQLDLKEENIKALKVVEQQCAEYLEKVKDLEQVNQTLQKDVNESEKKLSDMNKVMKEKELKIELLEYENLEIKDSLRSEKESVKICLECELMNKKLKKLDDLKIKLRNTETELARQKELASKTMKLLSETEDNHDEVRIRKEKEILSYKDTIQSLEHQLKMLKVEITESDKLKIDKEKLQMDNVKNETEIKRLGSENNQLRNEIDAQRNKIDALRNEIDILKFEKKSSSLLKSKDESKKEHDSLLCEASFKKQDQNVKNRSVPMREMKRKRAWDNESSGSECLEIVFDNNEKFVGCTPKIKSTEFKRAPISIVSPRLSVQHDQKLPTQDNMMPASNQAKKICLTPKPGVENDDFLSSGNINVSKLPDSPWTQRTIAALTPPTPSQRKFFKTPLNERELPFKKPQSQNLWF